jgi:hypothetical protein
VGDISAFRLLLAVWVVTAALLVAVVAGAVAGPSDGGGPGPDWRGRLRIGAAAFGLAVATVGVILNVAGLTGGDA